jgi:hypothetical protein
VDTEAVQITPLLTHKRWQPYFMKFVVLFTIVIYSGTVYSQTDCKKYKDDYIPIGLNDAITYLECTWSKKDKQRFRKQPEREATASLHFGTGLSIRNGWGLWKGENSLVKYFNSIGIFHPDDMSSIILTSFHRHLNNKDIDLEKQIQKYIEYWKNAEKKEKEWKEENKKEFETFNVGDSVKIRFSLKIEENRDRVYLLSKNFDFGDKANCAVTGIIRDKKILEDDNYTFVIEVMDICNRKEVKFGNEGKLVVGETFEYNVTYNNIERL